MKDIHSISSNLNDKKTIEVIIKNFSTINDNDTLHTIEATFLKKNSEFYDMQLQ